MNKRHLQLFFAVLTVSTVVSAQQVIDSREYLSSYTFVEAQGGAQVTPTHNAKLGKIITPAAAFSVGHFFNTGVGARLHVQGWEAKSGFKRVNAYYKWKYITTDVDLLLNINNLISKTPSHFLNVMLIGGIGLNYAWDKDEAMDVFNEHPNMNIKPWFGKSNLSHNIRAGVRLETDVTRPIGVSLELAVNNLNDRFNFKWGGGDDWMMTAMLGVTWRFGKKYKTLPPENFGSFDDLDDDDDAAAAAARLAKEREEAERRRREEEELRNRQTIVVALTESGFYEESKTDITPTSSAMIDKAVKWFNLHTDKTLNVSGYADKGTGNSKRNLMLSEQRAQKVADALKSKGVPADRIVIKAYGDTKQPFPENEKNRCVIIEGK